MSDGKSTPEPSMDEILASIRRILAEDQHAVMPPPTRSRVAAMDDILDLTEALNDDGSTRHIAPRALPPPEPTASDGRVEPAAPRREEVEEPPPLLSDGASEAITASFARLSVLPSGDGGDAQLEELVRQTLRPLLQAWLDANLPPLVERLVQAEIARVVGSRPLAP
jgi:cell pole-organizing protein PopZ